MYKAYKYTTGEIIAESNTISGLAKKLNISRITVSKHVQKNLLRVLRPYTYRDIVIIDGNTTAIMPPPPPTSLDDEHYHVYKASTGEYLCPGTVQAICEALDIRVKANVVKSIDRYALIKHNIYISTEYNPEGIRPPRPVYEIYKADKTLMLSTFTPGNYPYWKPEHMPWVPNPYQPNKYMAILPPDHWTVDTVIDYEQYPEEKLGLDNPENI